MADESSADIAKRLVGEIDLTAKTTPSKGGRRAKLVAMPRYQTLSDGQWHNPPSLQQVMVDDFTGEHIATVGSEHGAPHGPQPSSTELDRQRSAKLQAQISDAVKRQRAIEAFRRGRNPQLYRLRRV